MKLKKSYWGWAALMAALTGNVGAQLAYNPGDVLVGFRNTATPVYDLLVDAGPVSTFTNLPVDGKITINYSPSQLAYVGTNSIAWSASAAVYNYPNSDDVWLTRPRTSLNTQTAPLNTGSASFNSPIAGDIDSGGLGTDSTFISDTVVNTSTAIVETEAGHQNTGDLTGDCYYYWVKSATLVATDPGTFNGDAPGVVEQTTPANFSTAGQPVRADFYQLLGSPQTPNYTPGTYLGYFEFSTNGILTYTSGPSASAVVAPIITGFNRFGTTNIITFTTVSSGTYNLLGTNSLTIPVASWPVIGSSVTGDGTPKSITNVTANALNFYRITAH